MAGVFPDSCPIIDVTVLSFKCVTTSGRCNLHTGVSFSIVQFTGFQCVHQAVPPSETPRAPERPLSTVPFPATCRGLCVCVAVPVLGTSCE